MKKSILVFSTLGLLLSACGKKESTASKADAKPPEASTAQSVIPKPAFAATDSFKTGLGKVYEGYTHIESALAHDDFAGAQAAFSSMHGILHVIQTDGMDSLATAYWDSLDASFMQVLHPMASSPDLAGMREHFADFSPLVLDALEKFGAQTPTKAYLFHCPMARNNQGADWLQPDTSLVNPYFGKAMAECGGYVREVHLL
jgi:membrane fusion protein, copper/silver efflux system